MATALFQPLKTVVLAPNVSSLSTTIAAPYDTVRIYNGGSTDIFIKFSTTKGAGDTASTSDMILPSQYLEYYAIPSTDTVTVYCAASATVNVTFGANGN
jgi:hypothetical protein